MKDKYFFKKLVILWLPIILWAGFIFYLSSLRVKPPTGTWLDVVLPYGVHLTEYGVLFILIWRIKKNFLSFLLVFLYAVSDEFHQAFVPSRSPDIMDLLIDIAGVLISWLIIWKLLPKMPARLKNWAKDLQLI